jgi:heme/copper-type cytochrome/quinol oxidase subunit 4
MSTTLLYALIMGVAQIVVSLVSFFLGYQTDKINSGGWFGLVPLLISIVILVFGIRAVREEQEGKQLTYGKGVGTGVLISLYAGIIGAVYTYIHFTYVNPNFSDYLIEASRVKWAALGMSDDKIEAGEKGVRMFTKPLLQSVFGFVLSVVFGLVLSLIISVFLKRTPSKEGQLA